MNTSQSTQTETLYPPQQAPSKRDHVRHVFEDVAHYLASRRVDMRFRRDTVRVFASTVPWRSLLDVGCGDGSISLPLLTPEIRLTLMDLSAAMVSRARSHVPSALCGNVTLRNDDFLAASFGIASFDLIVSVGVLAHVDSPDAFLAKLSSLLSPNGHLILEFTDSRHFVGRLGRFWGFLKELLAPARYQTNKLSFARVAPLFEKHSLRVVSSFRYSRIPLPAIDRILSEETHHWLASRFFGTPRRNTRASFGNEYICLLAAK
ncbi:MAG: methyltransferase domain-containing protein [Edaphobacter sp.]